MLTKSFFSFSSFRIFCEFYLPKEEITTIFIKNLLFFILFLILFFVTPVMLKSFFSFSSFRIFGEFYLPKEEITKHGSYTQTFLKTIVIKHLLFFKLLLFIFL